MFWERWQYIEGGCMCLPLHENQRYGRNKETVVNKTYIESGEYRKKFDCISDNAELNKLLYQLAKKMLLHRSGTRYEDMYWINPQRVQIVASETSCNLEQRIVYSETTKRAIQGKTGLWTIHSHPNSFPPSLEDFNSNYARGNGTGVVCGHDGSVYVYCAEEEIPQEKGDFYYRTYYNLYRNEYDAQKQMLKILKNDYSIYCEEVTL